MTHPPKWKSLWILYMYMVKRIKRLTFSIKQPGKLVSDLAPLFSASADSKIFARLNQGLLCAQQGTLSPVFHTKNAQSGQPSVITSSLRWPETLVSVLCCMAYGVDVLPCFPGCSSPTARRSDRVPLEPCRRMKEKNIKQSSLHRRRLFYHSPSCQRLLFIVYSLPSEGGDLKLTTLT